MTPELRKTSIPKSYSVTGLFQRLEEDAARHPGSMSERRGAWAQLLSLSRMVHDGGLYQGFEMPARNGYLFDPERFEFLEGRQLDQKRVGPINAPPISDACIHQVLSNLLVLNSKRLSYRALGVEEIGSVYESMMGYDVECARAPSIVLQPKDVVVNLSELKEVKSGDRKKWLETHAELKFGGGKADKERVKTLASAQDEQELFEALKSKLSVRASSLLPVGSLYLQPGQERRRSGSHYTPRALSQPVVARALEPHFVKIRALPVEKRAEKILELKISVTR